MNDLHADENVYDSLAEAAGGEERWAFGTGFDDPLAGVDRSVPEGVDGPALARQCVSLGDDALVLAQRLSGWCAAAPELEDEVALANIALDLLGQARLLLSRAAHLDPTLRPGGAPEHIPDEDALAYFRNERAFRNVCLAELDDRRDFAAAIARLFVFVTWRLATLTRLRSAADPVLAAIAGKAVTELIYHREYAAGWVVRLGDGTEFSHQRMQRELDDVWPYLGELFDEDSGVRTGPGGDPYAGAGPGGDVDVRAEFEDVVAQVLADATLARPDVAPRALVAGKSGRDGAHTEAMGYLLAEMQSVARANPDATW